MNTGVGSLSLLQWIFRTQESNLGLLHCRRILYQLSYEGSPDSRTICFLLSCKGSVVKSLPAKQEMWVQSLGQKDPLEKEMATHSSILAQKIPGTEEPGRLQSVGSQRVRHGLNDLNYYHQEFFVHARYQSLIINYLQNFFFQSVGFLTHFLASFL